MYVWQTTTVHLGSDEWYDIDARVDGSNQRSKTGRFRMQVRQVVNHESYGLQKDTETTIVTGRRYKADGTLGRIEASATVGLSELPEPVMTALLDAMGVLE